MTASLTQKSKRQAPPQRSGASFLRLGWMLVQGVCCLVLTLLAVEVCFYFARVGDAEHLMPDSVVGFKPFANKRVTQRKEGYGCFLFNRFGMQDDDLDVAKKPGTLRVAIMGDSYVESLQVPRDSNYLKLAQKQLSQELAQPVEVLNFGVSNYSVAQDYLRYKTLARQFKPDIVILAFRVDETGKLLPNTAQALPFVRPVFFVKEKGQLQYDDTVVRSFTKSAVGRRLQHTAWLREHSRIYGLVGTMVESWEAFKQAYSWPWQKLAPSTFGAGAAPKPGFVPPTDETRSKFTSCYWYMMEALLAQFNRDVVADGARFVIFRTPTVRPGSHELTDNSTEDLLLQKSAAKLGIKLFNLNAAYKQNIDPKQCADDFLGGGHFTKQLHVWVADQLSGYLLANGEIRTVLK